MVDASGNPTPAWSFDALPPDFIRRLNDESTAGGFLNGGELLAATSSSCLSVIPPRPAVIPPSVIPTVSGENPERSRKLGIHAEIPPNENVIAAIPSVA